MVIRRGLLGRRTVVGAAIAALLAGGIGGPSSGTPIDATTPTADPTAPDAARSTTVTLVTGDRVTMATAPGGHRTYTVDAAPRDGGVPVTFSTFGTGRDYYVIPSDAMAYIAAGSVDRTLFDVPELVRQGATSTSGPPPVIIEYRGDPTGPTLTRRAADLPGSYPAATLESIDGAALDPARHGGPALWSGLTDATTTSGRLGAGVRRIWLDATTTETLDHSVPQIGAPDVWAAGYDGSGVTVAILDTGIDPTHPDLEDKVIAGQDFTGAGTTVDGNGHGTHVASIVAGSGAASGGQYRGVAPGASLMVGKVLDDGGNGQLSWAIDGMEWAAHNDADVVNLSLGAGATDGTDPGSQAVDALSAETGTLFVIASGNDYRDAAVSTPGAATAALTVGAVDDNDALAAFSNRGPRLGDAAVKPNITAPGVGIVAARAAGTSLGNPVDDRYTELSGTSMATPHVAASAALLAQIHPEWTGEQLKAALTSTATPGDYTVFQQGAGRVDVARAFEQGVYADATLDFGRLDDPATQPVDRTLTYRNTTDQPVDLTLTASGRGWDGQDVPADAIELSANAITAPADGTATIDLTIDPTRLDSGVYGGVVTATGAGGIAVRIPWSLYESVASHAVTVTDRDRDGGPADPGLPVFLVKVDPGVVTNDPFREWVSMQWTDGAGQATFKAAPGVYDVYSQITTWDVDATETTLAIASEVPIDGDTDVTLDARDARTRNPRVGESVNLLSAYLQVIRKTPDGRTFIPGLLLEESSEWVIHATPTPQPTLGSVESIAKFTYGSELATVETTGPHPLAVHPDYWPFYAGPTLAGTRRLPIMFAGAGEPSALEAARDKLALVRIEIPDGEPFRASYAWLEAQRISEAAAAAGAAGVLFYIDAPGAIGQNFQSQPLLQIGLSRADGERLRQQIATRPGVELVVEGRRTPRDIYHLRYGTEGYPDTDRPFVSDRQLATIPARYQATGPDQSGGLVWFAFSPAMSDSSDILVPYWAGAAWTEHAASFGVPVRWLREAHFAAVNLRAWSVLRPGDRLPPETWFDAPVHYGAMEVGAPYPTTLRCTFCRQGDRLVVGQYRLDGDDDHYEFAWYAPPQWRLFHGDEEIPAQGSSWRWFAIPPGQGTYRLQMTYTQPGEPTLAPRIETEWVFGSSVPSAGQLPASYECPFQTSPEPCAFQRLIQLRYDLGLDLFGTAPAGDRHTFEIRAGSLSGSVERPTVTRLDVAYSIDDGQTWHPADVENAGPGRFRVAVRHPAGTEGGFVTLRVHATNTLGDEVTQTLDRAYRLP
jgi:subtilisin family serine protease